MIPRLEDLSIGQRVMLTVGIVVVVILVVAMVGFLSGRWEAEGQEAPPSRYEEQLTKLELEALDEAFKKHMMRLYDIWVTDYTPTMPPRGIKGARNARDAYERYRMAIEKRANALGKPGGG